MTGWRIHGWVLMGNHYHLLPPQTPEANLVAGMQTGQKTLYRRFKPRHRSWGRLLGYRYKAVLLEDSPCYYYLRRCSTTSISIRCGLRVDRSGAWRKRAGLCLEQCGARRRAWAAATGGLAGPVAEGLENLGLPLRTMRPGGVGWSSLWIGARSRRGWSGAGIPLGSRWKWIAA